MEGGVISAVFGVFTQVLTWFITSLGTASSLFYDAETGLTLIGTVTIASLGIAVVLMVLAWLRSLFRFQ